VREIVGSVTRERLPQIVLAIESLPDVARCRMEITPPPVALAARVADNEDAVARARVLAIALDPRAIQVARDAAKAADAIGYPRQTARASLVHGLALLLQQQRQAAATALDRAGHAALEAGDVTTAVEAFARRAYAVASSNESSAGRLDDTLARLDLVFRSQTA